MIHFKKDMPNEDYHSHSAISRSGLITLLNKSPMHFKHKKDNGTVESDALRLGGAFHAMVLEPELFDAEYFIYKKPDLRTKDGKAEMQEIKDAAGDKTLINFAEIEQMKGMADSIRRQPAASRLINDQSIIECSFFWKDEETGIEVKARPDSHTPEIVIDLKTVSSAAPRDFEKSIINYGYDIQAHMCCEAVKRKYGKAPEGFVFICVEKEPPYACAFYLADVEVMQSGYDRYNEAMAIYADCLKTNNWYGYGNKIQPISIPHWAIKREV